MSDYNDNITKTFPIGTLIKDGEKIGIIYREIKSGTWTDQPLFNWRVNYEIFYDDGTVCIMGSDTIERLMELGKIEVIEKEEE